MGNVRIIDVNMNVFADNDAVAAQIREKNEKDHTFMINLMASPGAGKTSVLLRTLEALKDEYKIGVMEADIEASVDAEKIVAAGGRSIQVHTGGECAMNAEMTRQAIEEFQTEDLDLLILENVGNLVCPAEEDTGATVNVEILSIPEGDDKPLKYPLMFTVCQLILVNKIDTRDYFAFDDEAFVQRVKNLNPDAEIIFLSAKTGEGVDQWIAWLRKKLA